MLERPNNEIEPFLCLLELAANNDIDGFKQAVECGAQIDGFGSWYGRKIGTKQMAMEQRNAALIAALYGSLDVLSFILSRYSEIGGDINRRCGSDGCTALHCAAAGGAINALETVKLLLGHGADPNSLDSHGRRPIDVIMVSSKLPYLKLPLLEPIFQLVSVEESLSCSSSPSSKLPETDVNKASAEPHNIKNSSYATDEFRMFSFKVRPCSRAYSHDWTECPFVHPGENARRRDPRKYHYSSLPCPDFRKGVCQKEDACEYAHGIFECWLHPAQYRTRLCKDGLSCTRRVCFFAHTTEEIRPLYVSADSVARTQRASSYMDMTSLSPPFSPGSPSSVLMSPFSSTPSTAVRSLGETWQRASSPSLQVSSSSIHGSRLKASINARDIPTEDLTRPEHDSEEMSGFNSTSSSVFYYQTLNNAARKASGCGEMAFKMGKFKGMGAASSPMPAADATSLPDDICHRLPSILDAQMSSKKFPQSPTRQHLQLEPCITEPQMLFSAVMSPSFGLNSRIGMNSISFDSDLLSLVQPSQEPLFALGSPACATSNLHTQNMASISPAAAAARAAFLQRDKRSLSSRALGANFGPSDWGSPTGKPEWGVQKDDLCKLRKATSFKLHSSEDLDISWIQKLVKERQHDIVPPPVICSTETPGNIHKDVGEQSVLSSWIEQMHLDQIIA